MKIWEIKLELGSTTIEWVIKPKVELDAEIIYSKLESRIGRDGIKKILRYAYDNNEEECYLIIDDIFSDDEVDLVCEIAIKELFYPDGSEPEIKFIEILFERAIEVLNLEDPEDAE